MGVPRQHKVLIVDDSPAIRREIRQALESEGIGVECREASNGLEGFRALLDKPADLVLCDLVMPEFDGLKFLQLISSRPELEEVPVIMLTAIGNVDQKVKVLSSGASDYITKPFHQGELLARVKVHLKIKMLQDELRQKNALLLELSTTDGLTKIYNRRHFLELSRKEFERSARLGLQLSLLLFDVDHFKQINDTYGHQAGDDVLTALCRAVASSLREYDIFGRYGGDEFVVLFPQTDLRAALRVAERIEKAIAEIEVPEMTGRSVTISGGLVTKMVRHTALEALLKTADETLYQSKSMGRARITPAEE